MWTSEVNVSTKQLVDCYLLWHGFMFSMKRGREGRTDLIQVQASAILPPGGNQYNFFFAWCMCLRFNISQYRTLKWKTSVNCSIFFAEYWEEYRVHSWLRVTEDIGGISEERKWPSPDSLISSVKEDGSSFIHCIYTHLFFCAACLLNVADLKRRSKDNLNWQCTCYLL